MSERYQSPLASTLSRRQMLKLLGGVAGMTALAACAAPVAPVAPAEGGSAPAAAPIPMVVLHRKEYFEEMETIFRENVMAWAAENNVDMEVSTVGAEAFEDFVAKLVAQVEAGEPPDLVYHVRLVQQLYSLDALEEVGTVAEQAVALYGEVPTLNKNLNFIDGVWWGVPYSVHGGGPFARRDVFEAAGIDPDSLASYDQRRGGAVGPTTAPGPK